MSNPENHTPQKELDTKQDQQPKDRLEKQPVTKPNQSLAARRGKKLSSKPAKHRKTPLKGKNTKASRLKLFLVPLIGAFFGISLILYPVIATRHNNAEQQRTLEEYRVNIKEAKAEDLAETLKKADQYNNDLREGKIIDPFLVDVIPDSEEYQNYLKQLNYSKVLGQLIVPSVRINLPIYHGTEEDTLQKGLGHLFGSSLPVGGKATHAVLTGHSGLSNATMFDNLPKVKKGDKIFLNVAGRDMQYSVKEIKVVRPEETDSLKRRGDRDLLTLITCTPYGINSHRLFVTAEREYPVDEKSLNQAVSDKDSPWETWMIVLILIASSGIIAIGTIIGKTFILLKKRGQKDTSKVKDTSTTGENVQENRIKQDISSEKSHQNESPEINPKLDNNLNSSNSDSNRNNARIDEHSLNKTSSKESASGYSIIDLTD